MVVFITEVAHLSLRENIANSFKMSCIFLKPEGEDGCVPCFNGCLSPTSYLFDSIDLGSLLFWPESEVLRAPFYLILYTFEVLEILCF